MIERGEGPIDEILFRFGKELYEAGVDAVQILGTFQEGHKVFSFSKGFGNCYARDGLAREFLIRSRVQFEMSERQQHDEEMGEGEGDP